MNSDSQIASSKNTERLLQTARYVASSDCLSVSVHACVIQASSVHTPTCVLKCMHMFVRAESVALKMPSEVL